MRRILAVTAALALLLGAVPATADPQPGPGYIATDNVEWLGNIPINTGSAGARLHDGYLYVTEDRGLTIYDVADPALPVPVGFTPLPQMPYYTEEDVDTNGKILLIGSYGDVTDGVSAVNRMFVIDVSDKRLPRIRSWVDGANAHTISCVADCTYAYGSNGRIVDLRDPDKPILLSRRWTAGTGADGSHDVTEVAPGRVVVSTRPRILLLDTTDPADPKLLTTGTAGDNRYIHGNLWPHQGTDKFLLVGGETSGNCSSQTSGAFMTFDATKVLDEDLPAEERRFTMIDQYRVFTGLPTEGNSPYNQFCAHWFTTHPDYADGGLVAMGWYEHGTRFLNVSDEGKISEVGWFYPVGGSTSAAYWVTDEILYSVDYQRGIDILRFSGEASDKTVQKGVRGPVRIPAREAPRASSLAAALLPRDPYACPLPGA